jgi:hypothetical protein
MPSSNDGFSNGYDGHRLEQAGAGLRLSPAERLRWLESTMATLRRWQGRARRVASSGAADRAHDNPRNADST